MAGASVRLELATKSQRPVIERLLQLYWYEFSEMEQTDVGADGLFHLDVDGYIPLYWKESGRSPFLIIVDGKVAGFVLVNGWTMRWGHADAHSIGEFFVMRRYRRRGVGRTAAIAAFTLFPGQWEVAQIAPNIEGIAFWRDVISGYTEGRYEEITYDDERWRGSAQYFDNGGR